MPRDSAGNYNLVSGNPVQSGEVISSSWANNTMDDLAVALTDSLDRNGRGGMLAPFRFADGTNLLPGAAWVNETTTGFYRFDGGDLRISVLTQDVMRWQTTGVQIWNNGDTIWENVLTDGGSGAQVPVNVGTADGQTLRWGVSWEATSDLVVADDGNVGIGTDSPTERLTVAYAGNVDGDSAAVVIGADGAGASSRQGMIRKNNITNVLRPLEIHASVQTTNQEITFHSSINTERMRIDSAGNVGIGNDSPSTKLHVYGTGFDQQIIVDGDTLSGVQFSIADAPKAKIDYYPPSSALRYLVEDGNSFTFNHSDFASVTERMRIDSAGNVGIGRTPAARRLEVDSTSEIVGTLYSEGNARSTIAFVDNTTANDNTVRFGCDGNEAIFWSGGGERMRIDSSGNVLVGRTSTGLGNLGVLLQPDGAVQADRAGAPFVGNRTVGNGTVVQFYIAGAVAGNITTTSGGTPAFSSGSDAALKENIVDLEPQLANIMLLRPRSFNMKADGGYHEGFVAQEVESVYPDNVLDGEGEMEGYKLLAGMSKTDARLIKAIQELTARLEVLENG